MYPSRKQRKWRQGDSAKYFFVFNRFFSNVNIITQITATRTRK